MRLTAIFEIWHLGDGNYPPLHRGQLVNLSFEFLPYSLSKSIAPKASKFQQIKDAEYSFAGTVLKVYDDSPNSKVVVVQAEDFRFYINSFPTQNLLLKEGDRCDGFDLGNRCFVARGLHPESTYVIGLATERYDRGKGFSLDLYNLFKPPWSAEDQRQMEKMQNELGYFNNPRVTKDSEDEYPKA